MDRAQAAAMSDKEIGRWFVVAGTEDPDDTLEQLDIPTDLYTQLLLVYRGWKAVGASPETGTAGLSVEDWQVASDALGYSLEGWDYGFVASGTSSKEAQQFVKKWHDTAFVDDDGDIIELIPDMLRWWDTGQVESAERIRNG